MPAPFPLNLFLILLGAALVLVGFFRARGPWARYQALKRQDENVARYEAWRGGLRDSGTTGASVAMELLRKQARDGGIAIGVGIVFVVAGFLLR